MSAARAALGTVVTGVQDRPWLAAVALAALVLLLRATTRRRAPRPRAGELWYALVPFADGTGAKDRPVLVLAVHGRRCTVARLTSQNRDARRDYVRVPDGIPGLSRTSWLDLQPVVLRRAALRRRSGDPGEALVAWYDGLSRSS